eukprot:scaffold3709_cov68-Phaeocystis_antarctica.AAC.3
MFRGPPRRARDSLAILARAPARRRRVRRTQPSPWSSVLGVEEIGRLEHLLHLRREAPGAGWACAAECRARARRAPPRRARTSSSKACRIPARLLADVSMNIIACLRANSVASSTVTSRAPTSILLPTSIFALFCEVEYISTSSSHCLRLVKVTRSLTS